MSDAEGGYLVPPQLAEMILREARHHRYEKYMQLDKYTLNLLLSILGWFFSILRKQRIKVCAFLYFAELGREWFIKRTQLEPGDSTFLVSAYINSLVRKRRSKTKEKGQHD